jgi:serine/threonine protein kinase
MAQRGDGPVFMPAGYEFVEMLGRGSSGWVALAIQSSVGRKVAIKTLHGALGRTAETRRLRREGRVLAALKHPSIAKVYELIETGEGFSLVMEYVPGGDLQSALDHNSLSGSSIVCSLCDTGDALTYAASMGVMHRDVKPANVLLDEDLRAKVADFGLARMTRDPQGFRTMSSSVRGTLLYVAPEQIIDPGIETPTVDAYSFAVLCYRAVTGSYPYQASTPSELLNAHLHDEPISPLHFAPDLPADVVTALLAGLVKDPGRRSSPDELSASLRAVSADVWDESVVAVAAPEPESGTQQALGSGTHRSSRADSGPGEQEQRGSRQVVVDGEYQGPSDSSLATVPLVEQPLYQLPKTRSRLPRPSVRTGLIVGGGIGVGLGLLIALH